MAVTIKKFEQPNTAFAGAGQSDFGRDGKFSTEQYAAAEAEANVVLHDISGLSGLEIFCSANVTLTFYGAFLPSTPGEVPTVYPLYRVKSDLTGLEAVAFPTGGTNRLMDVPADVWACQMIGVLASGAANVRLMGKK